MPPKKGKRTSSRQRRSAASKVSQARFAAEASPFSASARSFFPSSRSEAHGAPPPHPALAAFAEAERSAASAAAASPRGKRPPHVVLSCLRRPAAGGASTVTVPRLERRRIGSDSARSNGRARRSAHPREKARYAAV